MRLDEERLLAARRADAWEMIAIGHEQLAALETEPDSTTHEGWADMARCNWARLEKRRQMLKDGTVPPDILASMLNDRRGR